MGSKRSLAPSIAHLIGEEHAGAAVLDVFAGMCAVGSEMAPDHVLFANDIHAFAEVIAEALFVAPAAPPTSLHARAELLKHFSRNFEALSSANADRLAAEARALARSHDGAWKDLLNFTTGEMKRFQAEQTAQKRRRSRFPYNLVTTYFSSAYFGVQQSITIDSLRYAIDRAPLAHRPYYLTALLQAASKCATAPGHFAQFLVPRDRRNTEYIAGIRERPLLNRFLDALDMFPRLRCKNRERNKVFREEATALLKRYPKPLRNRNLVIYADPPYSRAQYSRYYHVLETIVLYDYPDCTGKGRYRLSRHQTDLSKKAKVIPAMDEFISAAAQTGAPLYLSYPSNGLLIEAGVSLPDILRTYYPKVSLVAHEPLRHSTLGGAPGVASLLVFEDIFYARSKEHGRKTFSQSRGGQTQSNWRPKAHKNR